MRPESIERLAKEEGLEKGREEGLAALRELVLEALQIRFGEVSRQLAQQIRSQQGTAELKRWHRLALTSNALSEFKRRMR